MTQHTPLQHTDKYAVIEKCQSSHINAENTATQSHTSAQLEPENTKAREGTNASNAEPQMSKNSAQGLKNELSAHMAENAFAAERQNRVSSQSTISMAMGQTTEKRAQEDGDYTSNLKNWDFLQTASDFFALTAIAQEDNSELALTKIIENNNPAAFIVRACNSHDALIAALEEVVFEQERLFDTLSSSEESIESRFMLNFLKNQIKEKIDVIAKARGEVSL